MVSKAANFGKRTGADTPPRAATPSRVTQRTAAAAREAPDSRPNSVIARLDEPESRGRPIAIAPPGLISRLFARIPWFTLVLSYVLTCRFNAETAAATDWTAPGAPGHFTLLAMGGVSRVQVQEHGEWWR